MGWVNVKEEVYKYLPELVRDSQCGDDSVALGRLVFLWGTSQDRLRVDATRDEIIRWSHTSLLPPKKRELWLNALEENGFISAQKNGRYEICGNEKEIDAIVKKAKGRKKGGEVTKRRWADKQRQRQEELGCGAPPPNDDEPPPPEPPEEAGDEGEASSLHQAGSDPGESGDDAGSDDASTGPLQGTARHPTSPHDLSTDVDVVDPPRARDEGGGYDNDEDGSEAVGPISELKEITGSEILSQVLHPVQRGWIAAYGIELIRKALPRCHAKWLADHERRKLGNPELYVGSWLENDWTFEARASPGGREKSMGTGVSGGAGAQLVWYRILGASNVFRGTRQYFDEQQRHYETGRSKYAVELCDPPGSAL